MDTERKLRRAHILVVPYPSQGHVNPMLQFCKRLISKRTQATLVITKFLSKSFNLQSSSTAAAVSVATISDGFDDGGFRQAKDVDDYLAQMRIAGSQTLADLVKSYDKSGNPVDCIVYDAFLTWALDVAHKCGIKGAAFFTHACAVNYVYYYAACGVLKLPVEAAVELPGLPPLDLPDFPSFIYVHGSYPAYFKMVLNEFSNLGEADFVLVNTFYKLEEELMKYGVPPLLALLTLPNQLKPEALFGENPAPVWCFIVATAAYWLIVGAMNQIKTIGRKWFKLLWRAALGFCLQSLWFQCFCHTLNPNKILGLYN